jgi:hypothetical protein
MLQVFVPGVGPETHKHQVVGMDAKKINVRHLAWIDGENNRCIECFQIFGNGSVVEFMHIILCAGNDGLPFYIAVVAVINPDDPVLGVIPGRHVGQVFIQGLEVGATGLEKAVVALVGADPFLGYGADNAAAFGFGIFFIHILYKN